MIRNNIVGNWQDEQVFGIYQRVVDPQTLSLLVANIPRHLVLKFLRNILSKVEASIFALLSLCTVLLRWLYSFFKSDVRCPYMMHDDIGRRFWGM